MDATQDGPPLDTARHRVTYAALDPGTSVTEAFVYLKQVSQFGDRVLAEGEFRGAVEDATDLPAGWEAWPHQPHVQAYGDAWLERGRSPALRVPSALIPASNVLLNQAHADFHVETVAVHRLRGLTR